MKDFATTDEVARLFSTGTSTVRWWIAEGYLPAERLGKRYLIPRRALSGFVPPQQRSQRGRPRRDWIPKGWVSIASAAEYLQLSVNTVRHRVLRGFYPSKTLANGMRVIALTALRELDLATA